MPKQKVQYLIGTSGWNYPDWRGHFYPEDLPQKYWLKYYQTQFNIVEINATFYRRFDRRIFLNWKHAAQGNFKYIIKVHRYITHRKHLKNCKTLIKQFCRSARALGNTLALYLLQLPPSMPYDLERLKKAILSFDQPKKVVVEFRNKQWLTAETKALLAEFGCLFCIADSPDTTMQTWITAKAAYMRLHGRGPWFDYDYSQRELKTIAAFAKKLAKAGAKKIYILFNNDYDNYAAKNALYLKSLLK